MHADGQVDYLATVDKNDFLRKTMEKTLSNFSYFVPDTFCSPQGLGISACAVSANSLLKPIKGFHNNQVWVFVISDISKMFLLNECPKGVRKACSRQK